MPVIAIQSLEQFHAIINGPQPAVIDFWATWCGPCKAISPLLEKLSNSPESSDVAFYKVDVDQQLDIAQEVNIRAMPTFILFQNGNKVEELVGAQPQKLANLVENAKAQLT